MKLYQKHFDNIKKGLKSIEVRLFDEKRKNIELGDKITFVNLPDLNERVETKVVGISRFKSFRDLYSSFNPKKFAHPEEITVEEQILRERDIYSEEKEKKFGVIGIHIKLL